MAFTTDHVAGSIGHSSGVITQPDGQTAQILGAGTGTGDVTRRLGATTTEGLEERVYETTVAPSAIDTNLINVPANSILLSVQSNATAALTGGGSTVAYSIGTGSGGDPDKYGTSATLTKNSKISTLLAPVLLAAAEQMVLTGTQAGGAVAGDTALTVGSVRVVVRYLCLVTLDSVA